MIAMSKQGGAITS